MLNLSAKSQENNTVVWEYFMLQNFHALIFRVEKFSYKWTYGTKIAKVLLDVRRMAEIKIVKHGGGVRNKLLYSRIPCV